MNEYTLYSILILCVKRSTAVGYCRWRNSSPLCWEPRTDKVSSLSLKHTVCQNIAMHGSSIARNFFLVLIFTVKVCTPPFFSPCKFSPYTDTGSAFICFSVCQFPNEIIGHPNFESQPVDHFDVWFASFLMKLQVTLLVVTASWSFWCMVCLFSTHSRATNSLKICVFCLCKLYL